jgi:hypothetical protein
MLSGMLVDTRAELVGEMLPAGSFLDFAGREVHSLRVLLV